MATLPGVYGEIGAAEARIDAARAQQAAAQTTIRKAVTAIEMAEGRRVAARLRLDGVWEEKEAAEAALQEAREREATRLAAGRARGDEAADSLPPPDPMLKLPLEALVCVMSFWSKSDLGCARRVSWRWRLLGEIEPAEARLASAKAQRAVARTIIGEAILVIELAVDKKMAAQSQLDRAEDEEQAAEAALQEAREREAIRLAAQGAQGEEEADAFSRSASMFALPFEVLVCMVSFWIENDIGRARQVCRRWRWLGMGMTAGLCRRHERNIRIAKYADGLKAPTVLRDIHLGPRLRYVEDLVVAGDGTVFVSHDEPGFRVYEDHRHTRYIGSAEQDIFSTFCLCIGPGGEEIYAGLSTGGACAWRFDGTLSRTLTGHHSPVLCLAFGPDSEVYGGSIDGTICIWGNDDDFSSYQGHKAVSCLVASPPLSGEWYLYSGGADNKIKKWSSASQCVHIFEGHTKCVTALVFDPSGNELYSASEDKTIRAWNPDGVALRIFDNGHTDAVSSLAVSPDGRLYSGSIDNTIRIWCRDGKLLRILHGHHSNVTALMFHPDGSKLYSGSSDGTIKVW